MCRTIEEITEKDLIVQELDSYICKNGHDRDTLMMKVLRSNYIRHIQTEDTLVEVKRFIEESTKSPSIPWLLRNQTSRTFVGITGWWLAMYVVFRLIEISVGLEELVKGILP